MGRFPLVTLRALAKYDRVEAVMRAPLRRAGLGVPTFGGLPCIESSRLRARKEIPVASRRALTRGPPTPASRPLRPTLMDAAATGDETLQRGEPGVYPARERTDTWSCSGCRRTPSRARGSRHDRAASSATPAETVRASAAPGQSDRLGRTLCSDPPPRSRPRHRRYCQMPADTTRRCLHRHQSDTARDSGNTRIQVSRRADQPPDTCCRRFERQGRGSPCQPPYTGRRYPG